MDPSTQAAIDLLTAQVKKLMEVNKQLTDQIRVESGPRSKDLTIASTLKEWNGMPNSLPVTEFFYNVEAAAEMGGLSEQDKKHIVKIKVTGPAADFLASRTDLSAPAISYQQLKDAFIDRFKEKVPDYFCYTQFQTATQLRNESPEAFADRVRSLCLRTIKQTNDVEERRHLREEAERRLLAVYTTGLRGETGRQVRLRFPSNMKEAVQLAVTIDSLEQKEPLTRVNERTDPIPRKLFSVNVNCESCGKRGHVSRDCRTKQRQGYLSNTIRKGNASERERGDRKPVRCYACNRLGHVQRYCRSRDKWNRSGNENTSPSTPTVRQN